MCWTDEEMKSQKGSVPTWFVESQDAVVDYGDYNTLKLG